MDTIFGGAYFSDSTIILTNGVVIGTFQASAGGYGIGLDDAANLFSTGTPTNLNRIVRCNTVQEQANNWGVFNSGAIIQSVITPYTGYAVTPPQIRFRFTDWSAMAQDADHISGWQASLDFPVLFQDCQFHGGALETWEPMFNVTNCLFEGVAVNMWGYNMPLNPSFRNCTFAGGSMFLDQENGGSWTVTDSLFDKTIITNWYSQPINGNYNGYLANCTRITPFGANDVVLTNAVVGYQTSWLGRYYLPSGSIFLDKGSVNDAGLAGLYHFTTLTNQAKELNTRLDLGFHTVAMANGAPMDSDKDSLPDYVEDLNGNGIQDAGETGFTNADSDNDGLTDGAEVLVFHSNPLDAYSGNRASNGRVSRKDNAFYCSAPDPATAQSYQAGDTKASLTGVLGHLPGTFDLTLSGASANTTYDIYVSYDLGQLNWSLYFRGTNNQTLFSVPNPGSTVGIFQAGLASDTDGDGLTDGYETLVSHTKIGASPGDPAGTDSDGDGMPDGWEVAYGLNPNEPSDANGDLDGDGVSNLQEYQNGTNPAGRGELPGPSSRNTGLAITEIMYAPSNTPNPDQYEFVELFNSQPYPETLTGYGLLLATGATTNLLYTFPTATIGPGNYVVIARNAGNIPPGPGMVLGSLLASLPDTNGTILLTNTLGSVLLAASYSTNAPYPAAAAGLGHSLVLARPSFGEGNPAAWAASDLIGGSPCKADNVTAEPARSILINEVLLNANDVNNNYVEIYNHSSVSVSLSSYKLGYKPAGTQTAYEYAFPANTTIPASGFLAVYQGDPLHLGRPVLGFSLTANGGTVYLKNPAATKILDAMILGPEDSGLSAGRFGDGSPYFQELSAPTPGTANAGINIRDIVINEIMYNPLNGKSYQFIELFNKGGSAQSLNTWQLAGDISFAFPNVTIPSLGYFVIAYDPATLIAAFGTQLSAQNTASWNPPGTSQKLPHATGRIILKNAQLVVIDDVTYNNGGKWSQWSDGGGSSLELIDARSDNRLPSNWGDSDQTTIVTMWQLASISVSDTLKEGDTQPADFLEIILTDAGECLIDDVDVVDANNTSSHFIVPGSSYGFETDPGLKFEGNHEFSTIESTSMARGGSKCLHLKASGRGDYLANRVRIPLATHIAGNDLRTFKIEGFVRWLRGQPEVVMRLAGNYLEVGKTLNIKTLPTNLGTPGVANSITPAVPNVGPAIYDVSHSPVLPVPGQDVVVTARFHDPDGFIGNSPLSPVLNYRLDGTTAFTGIQMKDDGTGGDAIAGDGLYSATIPGHSIATSSGTLVAFRIEATDNSAAKLSSTNPVRRVMYPGDPAYETRECLVRFGELTPPGNLGTYRLWITAPTLAQWTSRLQFHNGILDGTFVYGSGNSARAIYNAGALYTGSAHSAGNYNGPTKNPCGYNIKFPSDDPLLGGSEVNLDMDGINHEQVMYWIAGQMGLPAVYRRFVNVYVNGTQRYSDSSPDGTLGFTVLEDTQKPDSSVIKAFFPADSNGELFKIEVWWESRDLPVGSYQDSTLVNHRKARNRWTWEKRADPNNSASDYDSFNGLVAALNPALNLAPIPADVYSGQIWACVDESALRAFAFRHVIGDTDAYSVGDGAGHNMYGYRPPQGKWRMIPYDLDYSLANTNEDLLNFALDPVLDPNAHSPNGPGILSVPSVQRAYWRGVQAALTGPLSANGDTANYVMIARYMALIDNGVTHPNGKSVSLTDAGQWEGYITRSVLNAQKHLDNAVGTVAFGITSGTATTQNPYALQGNAPVSVKTIKVNSVQYPITWTTLTAWKILVPIMTPNQGVTLTVQAYDSTGAQVGSGSIVVTYSGTYVPGATPLINEWVTTDNLNYNTAHNIPNILVDPADGVAQAWIELYNPANTPFTLDNYVLRRTHLGVDSNYSFPVGTTLPPGGFLLVWADNETTQTGMFGPSGDLHATFIVKDNDTVALVTPGGTTIDSVAAGTVGAPTVPESLGRLPDGLQPNTQIQVLTVSPRVPNSL